MEKSRYLPVTWNADINNNVVSESIPQMDKVTRYDILSEMCELTSSVKFITEEYCVDTVDDAVFLKGWFVTDKEITKDDLLSMTKNWTEEENDKSLENFIIDDELDKLEKYVEVYFMMVLNMTTAKKRMMI